MDFIASPVEVAKRVGYDPWTLRRACAKGKLKHAEKIGGRWFINATKEWPKLNIERDINEE